MIVLRLLSRYSKGIGTAPSLGSYLVLLVFLWRRINSMLASSITHSSSIAKAKTLGSSSGEELPSVF